MSNDRVGAGIPQGAAVEDEVTSHIAGVTDTARIATAREGGHGESAAAYRGHTSVGVSPREVLHARAVLSETQTSAPERSGEGCVGDGRGSAITNDESRGTAVDDRAGAVEGTDRREAAAGTIQVEGRPLAKIEDRRGHLGGADTAGGAGQLHRALVDIDVAGEGTGTAEDEGSAAGLGERAGAAADRRSNRQRAGGVARPVGRHDDFAGRGTELGAARDQCLEGSSNSPSGVIEKDTARADRQGTIQAHRRGARGADDLERIQALAGPAKIQGAGGQDVICRTARSSDQSNRASILAASWSGEMDSFIGGIASEDTASTPGGGGEADRRRATRSQIQRRTCRAGHEGRKSQGATRSRPADDHLAVACRGSKRAERFLAAAGETVELQNTTRRLRAQVA